MSGSDATSLGPRQRPGLVGVAGGGACVHAPMLQMLVDHHTMVPFDRIVTHRFEIARAEEAMQTALAAGDAMKVVSTPERNLGRTRPDRATEAAG